MENNIKKIPQKAKRFKALVLLVSFTIVLLIAEVYAWFSTQQNVSINNLQGRVQVAEGLQISLDAKSWKQEITFGESEKIGDDLTGVTSDWSSYDTGIGNLTVNSVLMVSKNIRPKTTNALETGYLNPVSTTGIAGNDNKILRMFSGVLQGSKLDEVRQVNTNEVISESIEDYCDEGYYAFDIYLRNTSTSGEVADQLQLDSNSIVQEILSNTDIDYGLKNSVRVAFALYSDTAELEDSQEEIVAKTYDSEILQVAIWEPNADSHSEYAKSQNEKVNEIISTATGTPKTYAINEIPTNSVLNMFIQQMIQV